MKTYRSRLIRFGPVGLWPAWLLSLTATLVSAQTALAPQQLQQCGPATEQVTPGGAAGGLPSSAYVNGQSTCEYRTGSPVCVGHPAFLGPYRSVAEGARGVAPGGVLAIERGLYREATLLNRNMELRALNGTVTINPPSLARFDLVADAADDNGLPLNPKWGGQILSGAPPDPNQCPQTTDRRCDGDQYHDPGRSECSNQFTYKTYGPVIICPTFPPLPLAVCGPHINWFGATYSTEGGSLTWDAHSCTAIHFPPDDDDYSMDITRGDRAGYASTRNNIHIEFDSGETVDRFDSPWWRAFKASVDLDDSLPTFGCGTTGPFASAALNGSFAIATGLLDFDVEHSVHVELHPVWALAINSPRVDYDLWAFFVRNWGNGGFCGRGQQFAYFPNNRYTFRLPWKLGATSVDVIGQTWHRYHTQNPDPSVRTVPGEGVFVTFTLDAPRDDGSMWDGELHLSWSP